MIRKIIRYPKIKSVPLEIDNLNNYIIQEKIDGSNIGIGFVNGIFQIQSRNMVLDLQTNQLGIKELGNYLYNCVLKMRDIIIQTNIEKPCVDENNFMVFGESFGNNMKRYNYKDLEFEEATGILQNQYFRVFDIVDISRNVFLNIKHVDYLCKQSGFLTVPVIEVKNFSNIHNILKNLTSHFTKYVMEGAIVKYKEEDCFNEKRRIYKILNKPINERFKKQKSDKQIKKIRLIPRKYLQFVKNFNNIDDLYNIFIEEIRNKSLILIRNKLNDESAEINTDIKNYLELFITSDYITKCLNKIGTDDLELSINTVLSDFLEDYLVEIEKDIEETYNNYLLKKQKCQHL